MDWYRALFVTAAVVVFAIVAYMCGVAGGSVAVNHMTHTADVVAEDGQMYHFELDDNGKLRLKKGSYQDYKREQRERRESGEPEPVKHYDFEVDPAPGRKYYHFHDRLMVRADATENNWVVYKP